MDIVEKQPTIGGRMAQLDKTFPTLDCSACILTPKMVDAGANENIELFTYSEVESVKGFVGNFTVTIRKKARSVRADLCTGCGECTEKCPSRKAKNEFNMGMDTRGAIYIPYAQAVPKIAVIDREHCLHFKTGKCGLCERTCSAKAIDFAQEDELVTRNYGAIVMATGFQMIDPSGFGEFGYGKSKDVLTSLEFERLMNAAGPTGGHLVCPSDGRHPKHIVFIQCVGSRDTSGCGKPYCSKICCMYTAKHAILVRDKYPDVSVTVFYIDVRTPGKNFDEFYRRAVEEYGVQYVKGMVGKVTREGGRLKVQGSDLLNDRQLHLEADMVVLAAAIEPDPTARSVASMLTASIDTNGFMTEAHPQAAPSGKPHGRRVPFGGVPGTQGHSRDRGPGERLRRQGHRPLVQAEAGEQRLRGIFRPPALQRLLLVRKGLPLRRHHLRRARAERQGRAPHRPRGRGERGGLPGLRRLHGGLPLGRDGP